MNLQLDLFTICLLIAIYAVARVTFSWTKRGSAHGDLPAALTVAIAAGGLLFMLFGPSASGDTAGTQSPKDLPTTVTTSP